MQKVKITQCPLINEWMEKFQHTHTVEYYLAIKRNEVLIHAITWIKLKNIMLSEKARQKGSHIV